MCGNEGEMEDGKKGVMEDVTEDVTRGVTVAS
jgi:hypothetical protein